MANVIAMQHHRCYINVPMDVSPILNVITTQQCGCYANIQMNVFAIANVTTRQRRRFYVNNPMNTSPILNVITTQCRRRYINISIDISSMMNALTTQLGTSCSFDSPGLARNEPTPGKHSQGDSTPEVLSFFCEGMVIARYLMAYYAEKP